MKTVVALYNNVADAERTVRNLVDSGVSRDRISLVANNQTDTHDQTVVTPGETSGAAQGAGVGAGIGAALGGIGGLLVGLGALAIPGIGPVLAAGPLAAALAGIAGAGAGAIAGGATGGIVGALTDMGVTEQQAGYFAEGVRRGGVLVTVQSEDAQTGRIKDLMNHNNPVDVNEQASEWRRSGWTGFSPQGEAPTTYTDVGTPTGRVETGEGYTNNPNPGFPSDMGANTRPTSDLGTTLPTTSEMDTVTRPSGMHPDMEPTAGDYVSDRGIGTRNFDYFQEDFRSNYANTFGSRGYSYDEYLPAYHYGYDLATNEQYRNHDWSTVEPEARDYWEQRRPGTWEDFKDAIRYSWMRVKDALS